MTTQTRRRVRRPKLADTNILRRKDFTEDLWTIWLEKPEGFTFKPGQYCTIGSEGVERAYSIVSAPYEEELGTLHRACPAAGRKSHTTTLRFERGG